MEDACTRRRDGHSTKFSRLNEVAEEEGYEIVKPPSKEALAYSFSLESALEIYDWWVELSRTSDQVAAFEAKIA